MRGFVVLAAVLLVVLCGCTESTQGGAAVERYLGISRELRDDGSPDETRESEAVLTLTDDGGAALTIDGCTVALVRSPGEPRSPGARRWQLDGDQPCELGFVDQVFAGDPVRPSAPAVPGDELDVVMWIARDDGSAPSLIEFAGTRRHR